MELKMEGPVEFANKVKDTYDYLTGKRTHDLSGLNDATDSEIKSCPELDRFVKSFKSSKGEVDVQIDSSGESFLVTFSATAVPKDLADQIKPGGKYYDMISHYDKSSKSVEMIFTKDKKESVMQPTPTPYKLELKTEGADIDSLYELIVTKSVPDFDGFLTDYTWYKSRRDGLNIFVLGDRDVYNPLNTEVDFETPNDDEAQEWFDSYNGFDDDEDDWDSVFESLIETAGLDTSVLVRKINDDGVDSIEMDINDRVYSFTMKEESPYTIDQMFHKVSKMRHYSEGRALAFMKKNMIGKRVESLLREGVDLTDDIHKAVDNVYRRKDKFKSQDDLVDAIYGAISDCLQGYQFLSRDKSEVIESILRKELDRLGIETESLKESGPERKMKTVKQYEVEYTDSQGVRRYGRYIAKSKADALRQFNSEVSGATKVTCTLRQTQKVQESGNPFKDKHICNGCGKPLSQCSCEVQAEEEVEEALTEAVSTETYKTIKIELHDPDSQLENLIKCVKASSDPGHSFNVVVDGDSEKSFWIDGDGSFRISSIEVNDEVEDVEIDESLIESPDKDNVKEFLTTIYARIDDACILWDNDRESSASEIVSLMKSVSDYAQDVIKVLSKSESLKESTSFDKDDWVVVNIEPRLKNPVNLIPVHVSMKSSRTPTFRGWAWGEREYEYSNSAIKYRADSEEDAMAFIKENEGQTVAEFMKRVTESLIEKLDFTECEVFIFNPKTNEQDTMIVTASDEMDAIDVAYERIFSEFGMTRDEYDEECGPINQVDVRPMYTEEESLIESSTFAGDAYLEPGTLVDFGLYGSLYVVKDNGDSWIVSYNKDGSGKTWSMKKYLGQGVIEDPLVAQKNDPDAPYEVLSISVNDDGVVEAQCVDFIDGTDFEKTIGDPKSSEGKNNAHKLLRDYSYYIDNKLRDEIVSTFGLKEDIGSGATQPSSVGQFKKGSLDMFPDSDK